jgi:uncharacterized lipoprotein YddW (UPF0748 family)
VNSLKKLNYKIIGLALFTAILVGLAFTQSDIFVKKNNVVTAALSTDTSQAVTVPIPSPVQGSTNPDSVQEMRAVWIASVQNMNWPLSSGLNEESQKSQFITLLDKAKDTGFNTVMVQVRPMSDALYPSEYYPWSHFLTGSQGQSLGYDPLEFMIQEASKRGLKFYAWFNPYRVTTKESMNITLAQNNPAVIHPDWVVNCGNGAKWFNPGIPEARQYIINGILEVVKKYNIEGVVLDDYFYPYPDSGEFADDDTYEKYGQGFSNKGDWRRNNINIFVSSLHNSIKDTKSGTSFGISPFGIWRNKKEDAKGSATNGLSGYDALYADSRKWIKDGILDFIAPQIYWTMDFKAAPYKTLVDWWSEQVRGTKTKLYISQAAYKVGSSSPASWSDINEYRSQILYNRQKKEVKGSIHFNISNFIENKLGVTDMLKSELYK